MHNTQALLDLYVNALLKELNNSHNPLVLINTAGLYYIKISICKSVRKTEISLHKNLIQLKYNVW